MRRFLYAAIGLAGLIGCGFWIYTQWYEPNFSALHTMTGVLRPDRPFWIQVPVILVLLVLGAGFLAESFSSNIYRVYDGKIVGRKFTPEHTNPSYTTPMLVGKIMVMQTVPATHVPDEYRLQLRRGDGRVGWVSVTKSAYATRNYEYIDLRSSKKR